MKTYFAFIICLLAVQTIYSQKTAEGYYVRKSNDTVKATIVVPKGFLENVEDMDMAQGVEIIKGESTEILTPSEIKAYGFSIGERTYIRVSKPITKYRNLFFVPEVLGDKVTLYMLNSREFGVVAGGTYNVNSSNFIPMVPSITKKVETTYTFEKKNGTALTVSKKEKFHVLKDRLKEFFADSPGTVEEIDKKIVPHQIRSLLWKNIKEIVTKYNEE